MKKIITKAWFAVILLTAAACTDDISSLNTNPKAYQSGTVDAGAFFANATRNLTDRMVYEGFRFKTYAQQFSETTYFTTSSWQDTDIGASLWEDLYVNVLNDYAEAKAIITETPSSYADVDQNQLAVIELMEVYTYSVLVSSYGDIPYAGALDESLKAEALDTDNTTPAYDDQEAVYDDLLDRLDAALADLNTDPETAGDAGFGDYDVIYADDISMWVKFGNVLKLRLGMVLAEYNSSKAQSIVESVDFDNLFTSNDDNAELTYLSTTPNTNPIWDALINSGREDYVASNTMIDMMQASAMDDPRIPLYYTVDNDGGYSGGTYGTSNSYVNFSKAGDAVTATTCPGVLLDYVEVEFYLAEAAAREYGVSGTAEEHYINGITASIVYWGGSESDAASFVTDPDIAYATAIGSTEIEKIARQRYIAMFNRGYEAWVDYRRIGYPELNLPPSPGGAFPDRYTYPVDEQTNNGENYTAAAESIGSDVLTTLVFWDVAASPLND